MKQPKSNCSLDEGWDTLSRNYLARIESYADSMVIGPPMRPIFTPAEFLSGYSVVYSLCTGSETSNEEPIYLRLCKSFTDYLKGKVSVAEDTALSAETVVDTWMRYGVYVAGVCGIFSYLDRFYVHRASQPSLRLKALEIFQVMIFEKQASSLKMALLAQLDARRSTMEANEILITEIARMYLELDGTGGKQYHNELEGDIVQGATKYYSVMSPIWVNELSLVDYLCIVEHCMEQEAEDSSKWLLESTKKLLINAISQAMLTEQLEAISAKKNDLDEVLQAWKQEDLRLVYRILGGLDVFIPMIADAMRRHAQEAIKHCTSFSQFLASWSKYQDLMKTVFDDRGTFNHQEGEESPLETLGKTPEINIAITKAVKEVFRKKLSEDIVLIKGFVDHWDDVIVRAPAGNTELLQECCAIFELLGCRELFFQFYKFRLATRLLHGKSSLNIEATSLHMLEKRSPVENTFTLRRMLNEITESRQNNSNDIVSLISKANWPLLNDYMDEVKLSDEFNKVLTEFEQSQKRHIHRTIEYNRMLGRVELEFGTGTALRTLTCDLAQASVLLLFVGEPLSVEYIKETLRVSTLTVMSILKPLAEKEIIEISDGNTVVLKANFNDGVDVTLDCVAEHFNSKQSPGDGNMLETSTRIDSCIVSLLKRAKSLRREELLTKLSGFPREAVIKQIEQLHKKEYITVSDEMLYYVP